jgi:hypothetical protein
MYVAKGEYSEYTKDNVYSAKGKYSKNSKEAMFADEGQNEPLTKEGNNEPLAKNGNWAGNNNEPLVTKAIDRVHLAR